jgi:hypothetical protein
MTTGPCSRVGGGRHPQGDPQGDDVELAEFKPCKIILEDAGITQFVFEDAAHYTAPVIEGEYHSVDWMIAMDDGRLVGLQFWKIL